MSEREQSSDRYRERMERRKRTVDRRIAKATEDRGVVVVLTGNGKGKSSSAFGMVARSLGHGHRVGVVQFIKGKRETGERLFFAGVPEVDYHVMGTGFTWETRDRDKDRRAFRAVWPEARRMLTDESLRLVVLDELTYCIKHGHVTVDEVAAAVRSRPRMQSVVITGRGAQPELQELADTVSRISAIRHAFKSGVKAQPGVEW